jgi:hypothetical protein
LQQRTVPYRVSHLNAFSTKNAFELGVVEQVPLLIGGASDI